MMTTNGRRWTWDAATHTGTREENEDHYEVVEGDGDSPSIAVVCDGMGGHRSGEVAARTAAEKFTEFFRNTEAPVRDRLQAAIDAANSAVDEAQAGDCSRRRMGTTLTACAVGTDGRIDVIWAGDSPLYLLTADGELTEVTTRHNAPGHASQLTSAIIGIHPIPMVGSEGPDYASGPRRVLPWALDTGDRVIVASDGLDTLSHDEIKAACGGPETDGQAARVVDAVMATKRERQDNVTVVVGTFG